MGVPNQQIYTHRHHIRFPKCVSVAAIFQQGSSPVHSKCQINSKCQTIVMQGNREYIAQKDI